jgi:uncharacterized protein (DUF58 family)
LSDTRRQSPRNAATLNTDAEGLAAPLPPLLVAAERLAALVGLGVHGRRKAGMGETFWQFRRYGEGDPAAMIDWRQSAKSQHVFVREREWESAQAAWFWRDASPGMRFASDRALETKFDRANLLALALAALLARGGERVALLGEDRAPSSGRIAVKNMAHGLAENLKEGALPPDVPRGKNAQLVWFSDFLSPLSEIEAALHRLASAGIQCHLVHVVDPAEQDFPFAGRTRFEWQGISQSEIFGRAENIREDYRRRFRAHGEAVNAKARRLGFTYLAHRTDKRPQTALAALYANVGGARADWNVAQAAMR